MLILSLFWRSNICRDASMSQFLPKRLRRHSNANMELKSQPPSIMFFHGGIASSSMVKARTVAARSYPSIGFHRLLDWIEAFKISSERPEFCRGRCKSIYEATFLETLKTDS